jgi:hypothetical protein
MASPVFSIIVLFFISFLASANGQFCGSAQVATSFSFGSEFASRGQWPWLVPLLTATGKYFCGSTIVSDHHLLTGKNLLEKIIFVNGCCVYVIKIIIFKNYCVKLKKIINFF